ncbi:D-isomer specific 2-hydroxyacid dehydrogenase family protein [Clostridium folliculivorans]|uniref:D-isomer specific 2-hydroxyacid dehydrogenase family protein n=1 Tax=Clostridium folliculivorans TaxID=2886038 RepID=UPI0021C3330E|nr:D-isomer specific 2-hydroxyacid dehydrogenase family protein [Clostridium folliculivorans]
MKVCVFNYREFDEAQYFKKISEELGVELIICRETPTLSNIHLSDGCDCISIITTPIDEMLIKKLNEMNIKMISTRTVGFDHINIKYAKELGIHVSNATYSPNGVADYAIMLMMMASRNMKRIMERGNIQDFSLQGLLGREFANMKIGIIGTGRIGETVIRHLSGFGNQILAYSLYENEEVKKYARYVSLDELLGESDIISLHTPVDDENYHMIDAKSISKMKDQVIIVNTARGALIDTKALLDGIESRKVGAAALDVIENEAGLCYNDLKSEVLNNRDLAVLKSYPNVIVTPHMAFYTNQDVQEMVYSSLKSCVLEVEGKENPWRVV